MPPKGAVGKGRGRPPKAGAARGRGAGRAAPTRANLPPIGVRTRRARIAEPSVIPKADLGDEVYQDMEEEGSVAPAYMPERETVPPVTPPAQPIPPVTPVVPPGPSTMELVALMSAPIAEAFRTQNAEARGPACSGAMREFLRMNPPTFHGGSDHMAAESWLDQIMKALDSIQITDDATRILLATYQLRDSADLW